MAADARPRTATRGVSSSGHSSTSTSGGIRGIRAVASESWDDDFLWQHSSSSDLHLPSTSSRRPQNRSSRQSSSSSQYHHTQQHQQQQYRDKRLSAASSSSEFYAPRPPTRPQAVLRKSSTLSTSTTGSDGLEYRPTVRGQQGYSALKSSTSTSGSNAPESQQWAYASRISLQEDEDEPTITLATIAARQAAFEAAPAAGILRKVSSHRPALRSAGDSNSSRSAARDKPSLSAGISPASDQCSPIVLLPAASPSPSSWRSPTPSLASSDAGNATAGSATETDNETEEIDTWGELVDSGFNAVPIASGSASRSTHKRRNTLSATPRMALSALFGKAQPSPTIAQPGSGGDSGLTTPTSTGGRFGAALFKRASKTTRRHADEPAQPVSPNATASRGFLPDSTSTATIVPASSAHTSLIPRLRAPFVRNTSTPSGTSDISSNAPSGIFGNSPSPSASATHRYFENPHSAQHTVRARQSASPDLPPVSDTARYYYDDEAAYPPQRSRIAKSSGNSVTLDLSNTSSAAPSRLSYQSALSDRHVFAGRERFPASSQCGHGSPAMRPESAVDYLEALNTASPGGDTYLRNERSRREHSTSPERSTTSLVSQQSAVTYTSGLSECGNANNAAQNHTATRRKLKKKTRPHVATSQLPILSTPTNVPSSSTRRHSPIHPDTAAPVATTSGLSAKASPAASLAPSLRTKTDDGSTSETASASSKPKKSRQNRKLGVAGSLTRKLSSGRPPEQAAESSADEAEFEKLGARKAPSHGAKLLQAPSPSPSLSQTVLGRASPSRGNIADGSAGKSTVAFNTDSASWGQSESDAERSGLSNNARNSLQKESAPLENDRGIWAGLSKRLSRDFKVSKVPFPSPERKKSTSFRRSETPQVLESVSSVSPEGHDHGADPQGLGDAPQAFEKKHKRPLSLSGFLSRSSTFLDGARSRSSTASSGIAPVTGPLSASLAGSFSASSSTNSASTSGYKSPAGFLHRSTASSGNIPTARALLGISSVQYATLGSSMGRNNEAEPHSAPALQHRRSFKSMWRSPPTVPEERPASSLSLLSETSTVRPLPIFPPHMARATRNELTSMDDAMNVEAPPPKLRPRHLPSLSWTLNPGTRSGTLEGSSTRLPHMLLHRSLTESPQAPAPEPLQHGSYFELTGSSRTSVTHSRATTPGGRSSSSQGSGDSPASIVRRVSLSDLRIPQRISNAQAKIGQDLKRVKEFKDGVEELKRLRRIYKSLVATERTPDTSVSPTSPSQADEDASDSDDRPELSPSPPPLPAETSARVDHILARVAFDYQEWWEIADVLINLADGAEEDDPTSPARERCQSEVVRSSPTIAHRELGSQTSVQESDCQNGQPDRMAEDNLTTNSTLSLFAGNLRSTPVARALPMLSRSYSTSSFSPSPVTQRQQAGEPQDQSFASGSCMPCSGSREVIGIEGNTTSLSERQLEILRGMLKPTTSRSASGSHGRALATTAATAPSTPSRSSASISSSPAPSFAAGWATGSDSMSWKSESQMQAHFSPLSPLSSRERQLGNGQIHTSASYTSLKRKASMKVGSVLVSARDEVEPRASTSADGTQTPRETSPFHISNMLPLPRAIASPTTHAAGRVPLIRRTTIIKPGSPLTPRNTELAHSTSSIATAAVRTASPAPMARKGRSRQASRAGMMGIRDFLKALNSSTSSRQSPMSSSLGSIRLEEDHGQDHSPTATGGNVSQDPLLADEGSNAVEVLQVQNTPASAQPGEDFLDEPASVNTTRGSSSAGTSSSDEDWDRHSSDEADSAGSHAPPVDATQSRPLAHSRQLPRSDTEMTVMPMSSAMHASSSLPSDQIDGVAHSTPAKRVLDTQGEHPHLSPDMTSSLKKGLPRHAIPLLRSRTYSTNSTTTLGTIQVSFRGGSHTPSHHQLSQGMTRSPVASIAATPGRDAGLSVGGRTGIALGTKLVMTSEAMPTLLAKITEVKQHCATCVTELRNVTV